jgi:hypothetical protein
MTREKNKRPQNHFSGRIADKGQEKSQSHYGSVSKHIFIKSSFFKCQRALKNKIGDKMGNYQKIKSLKHNLLYLKLSVLPGLG